MAKGLGIAAFVFLLLSFPIPVAGNFITFLALALVTAAALCGDKVWTVTVTIISGVKLFFMSPSWMILMFGSAFGPKDAYGAQMAKLSGGYFLFTLLALAAPIAALLWKQAVNGKRLT